jgi:hypothetical protein
MVMITSQWNIMLSESLIDPNIQWYHQALAYVGVEKLYQLLSNHFGFPISRTMLRSTSRHVIPVKLFIKSWTHHHPTVHNRLGFLLELSQRKMSNS